MIRLEETVRVGTSRACVLHGHPKKAGSATDRPKGSEMKCYPFSGEGGRAGAIKKAYAMHYAIQKSQERGEDRGVREDRESDVKYAAGVLERNPTYVGYVDYYSGRKPFPGVNRGHGLPQEVWREAWRRAKNVMVVSSQVFADAKILFDGKPSDYKFEGFAHGGMARLREILSGSEALYGFCGWLTSRPERTVMSASDDAGGVADLVGEFSKVQGLPAPREGWDKELVSMNPLRRNRDRKAKMQGEGLSRFMVAVEAGVPALEKGIHFRSKDWAEANEFSLSRRFPMAVMKGDDGEFWVVRPPDAERLAAAGYEYAR